MFVSFVKRALLIDGSLLLMKGSSSMNLLPALLPFFELDVTNNTVKPNCLLPVEDNDSSNVSCSSGKLIFEINEAQF
jgi:hypothetical protein